MDEAAESFAAAALEEFGLTYGDVRPGNMLLDSNWNLKLNDIDRAMKIGEEVTVITEDGEGASTYGKAGARTKTLGSVYYTLLRGHEPLKTEAWGREHLVILSKKFQDKDIPPPH